MFSENLQKRLLRDGITIGLTASLLGIPSSGEIQTSSTEKPVLSAAGDLLSDWRAEVYEYYPEIVKLRLPLKSAARVATQSGIPTKLYNFTSYDYDLASANITYRFLERVGSSRSGYATFIGDRPRILVPRLRPLEGRMMVIIPPDIPIPSNWENVGVEQKDMFIRPGYTAFSPDDKVTFSIIKTGILVDDRVTKELRVAVGDYALKPEVQANRVFTVESCQQVIEVHVYDFDGKLITNSIFSKEGTAAQEVLCNSIGVAILFRQLDVSYADYVKAAGNIGTSDIASKIGFTPLVMLSKEHY